MAGQSAPPCIVWFRDDLRLSDHPALHAASCTGAPVICLYVFDQQSQPSNARPLGGAARWWLAQSLRALQKSLNAIGSGLVLRKGPAAKAIADLAREIHAGAVFWNEIAQAPDQAIADQVAAALKEIGVTSRSFCRRSPGGACRHPKQGRAGTTDIHPVLAAGAIAGGVPETAAGAVKIRSRTAAAQRAVEKLAA